MIKSTWPPGHKCKGCSIDFDRAHPKQQYCIACNFTMAWND